MCIIPEYVDRCAFSVSRSSKVMVFEKVAKVLGPGPLPVNQIWRAYLHLAMIRPHSAIIYPLPTIIRPYAANTHSLSTIIHPHLAITHPLSATTHPHEKITHPLTANTHPHLATIHPHPAIIHPLAAITHPHEKNIRPRVLAHACRV